MIQTQMRDERTRDTLYFNVKILYPITRYIDWVWVSEREGLLGLILKDTQLNRYTFYEDYYSLQEGGVRNSLNFRQ